jgi:hypothetical protein
MAVYCHWPSYATFILLFTYNWTFLSTTQHKIPYLLLVHARVRDRHVRHTEQMILFLFELLFWLKIRKNKPKTGTTIHSRPVSISEPTLARNSFALLQTSWTMVLSQQLVWQPCCGPRTASTDIGGWIWPQLLLYHYTQSLTTRSTIHFKSLETTHCNAKYSCSSPRSWSTVTTIAFWYDDTLQQRRTVQWIRRVIWVKPAGILKPRRSPRGVRQLHVIELPWLVPSDGVF